MVSRPHSDKTVAERGFTLIEALIVVALGVTTMAIGAGFYRQAADTIQGDANLRIVNWQLKLARETAINQRRTVEVDFVAPNIVRLVRREIPNGTTVLYNAVLENGMQFFLFTGQPDTPDGFGRPQAVWFGGASPIVFTADGMLSDVAGNPVNGSVFLGKPGRPMTSRALSIIGATATLRPYRWNGSSWQR